MTQSNNPRWTCGAVPDTLTTHGIEEDEFIKCTLIPNHKNKHRFEIVCEDFINAVKSSTKLQYGAKLWMAWNQSEIYFDDDAYYRWCNWRLKYGL